MVHPPHFAAPCGEGGFSEGGERAFALENFIYPRALGETRRREIPHMRRSTRSSRKSRGMEKSAQERKRTKKSPASFGMT